MFEWMFIMWTMIVVMPMLLKEWQKQVLEWSHPHLLGRMFLWKNKKINKLGDYNILMATVANSQIKVSTYWCNKCCQLSVLVKTLLIGCGLALAHQNTIHEVWETFQDKPSLDSLFITRITRSIIVVEIQ